MVNSIRYSNNGTARIIITPGDRQLQIAFTNYGPVITERERQFIFRHFFRGENSQGTRGFGLGLVFVYKIFTLHGGTIHYLNPSPGENTFLAELPLS